MKRLFSFLALSLLYLTGGCAQLTVAEREQMFGSHPPRIVKADAQSKMLYPSPWTIFLHVEDPDGDLTGFAGWVRLLGGLDEFYTLFILLDYVGSAPQFAIAICLVHPPVVPWGCPTLW